MAAPSFQLFPPPRGRRQMSLSGRPSTQAKHPSLKRSDSATAVHLEAGVVPNLHELIIQVDSSPVSSSNQTMAPATPPQAYTRSPPQQRTQSSHLKRQEDYHRAQNRQFPKPRASNKAAQQSQMASPDSCRASSPAFSSAPTLVRANSTATRVQSISSQEDIPMRSMFPVYDPTVPLASQSYKPTQASPTQLPRTQISRSPYSPEFYVPHNNVRNNGSAAAPPPLRPFFTPSNLLDNLWLATNGQEEPTVQIYTLRMHRATSANPTITFGTTPSLPFYSLAQSNLAAGNDVPSIVNELLIQRHHPTQPRVLPIAHLDLTAPPSLDSMGFDPQQQAASTLLTNIYPKLAALQALDAAANSPVASRIALSDPGAQSSAAQRLAEDVLAGTAQRECCTLAWTRDDPQQQANPWAQHIPSEGSYQLCHPTLGSFPISVEGDCSNINAPPSRPVTAMYSHNAPVTPHVPGRKSACITLLNPYVLSPTTPRRNVFAPLSPPPQLDPLGRPTSLTPSEMSVGQLPTTTDATADDAMLARLDFANDALILNVAAMTRFGNPFLVDVVASALLAVAVAEAKRGRKSRNKSQESFEPPPPSLTLTHQKEDTKKAFKESFVEGFQGFGGKSKGPMSGKSLKKFASSMRSTTRARSEGTSFDKDIELGEWYGQDKTKAKFKESKADKKTRKQAEDKDKLPLVSRTIIGMLSFLFKTIVWFFKIATKVIAGLVVMITRNFSKL